MCTSTYKCSPPTTPHIPSHHTIHQAGASAAVGKIALAPVAAPQEAAKEPHLPPPGTYFSTARGGRGG